MIKAGDIVRIDNGYWKAIGDGVDGMFVKGGLLIVIRGVSGMNHEGYLYEDLHLVVSPIDPLPQYRPIGFEDSNEHCFHRDWIRFVRRPKPVQPEPEIVLEVDSRRQQISRLTLDEKLEMLGKYKRELKETEPTKTEKIPDISFHNLTAADDDINWGIYDSC